jgi:hypothetical protein
MALQDSVLAGKLKAIFDAMDGAASGTPKDNQWYADQLAKAIDDQIKTAQVSAGIPVTIPTTSASGSPSQGSTSAVGSL